MSTDETGYLTLEALAFTGLQADGVFRSVFRRDYLESALWSYGEDDCLGKVRAGLTPQQVYEIGVADYLLTYTSDPDSVSGAGYPSDKALALAAVEVLEGSPRTLHRTRRRTKPK